MSLILTAKSPGSSRTAIQGNVQPVVSLGNGSKTMSETDADMKSECKETARCTLTTKIVECQ